MQRCVVPFVGTVAFLIRVVPLLHGGGLLFWGRYDDGVYFTASASLLDGRVPYGDFVLLHPPLIMLALLPFTLLARLTSDPTGLVAARVVWMLLGTVTAMLVTRYASRWGTAVGLAAGLWFACSAAASYATQATFIEPVADLALFGAVMLLTCDHERPRHELAGGVLLGIALTGKIWYVAPVAVVLLVLLIDVRRPGRLRSAARAAVAASATAVVILLPFFALAPREMWHMVVYDQLSRPFGKRTDPLDRLGIAIGGRSLGLAHGAQIAVTVAVTVAFVIALASCARDRRAWLVGAVALADVGVLMASPVVFHHYGAFTAAPVACTLAVGWANLARGLLGQLRVPRLAVPLTALVVAAILAGGGAVAARPLGRTFPTTQVREALGPGCVTADDPTTLILADRLSSDLRAGCPVAVDVTGASYGVRVGRGKNLAYQVWLRTYLRSGAAMILARKAHDGLRTRPLAPFGTVVLEQRWVHVLVPSP